MSDRFYFFSRNIFIATIDIKTIGKEPKHLINIFNKKNSPRLFTPYIEFLISPKSLEVIKL